MTDESLTVEVNLGRQGRLVVPAALRRALKLDAGDRLVARVENGRLVFEKAETIKRRVRARFAQVPQEMSLVDELLNDRRREAREES